MSFRVRGVTRVGGVISPREVAVFARGSGEILQSAVSNGVGNFDIPLPSNELVYAVMFPTPLGRPEEFQWSLVRCLVGVLESSVKDFTGGTVAASGALGSGDLFDGAPTIALSPDDSLELVGPSRFDFSGVDFSIDLMVNPIADSSMVFLGNAPSELTGSGGHSFEFGYSSGTLYLKATSTGHWEDATVVASAQWSPTLGQWNHVAVSRRGTLTRLFANGTRLMVSSVAWSMGVPSAPFRLHSVSGAVTDLRAYHGLAKFQREYAMPTVKAPVGPTPTAQIYDWVEPEEV